MPKRYLKKSGEIKKIRWKWWAFELSLECLSCSFAVRPQRWKRQRRGSPLSSVPRETHTSVLPPARKPEALSSRSPLYWPETPYMVQNICDWAVTLSAASQKNLCIVVLSEAPLQPPSPGATAVTVTWCINWQLHKSLPARSGSEQCMAIRNISTARGKGASFQGDLDLCILPGLLKEPHGEGMQQIGSATLYARVCGHSTSHLQFRDC